MDADAILSAEPSQPESVDQSPAEGQSEGSSMDKMFSQRFSELTKKERELLQKERELDSRYSSIKEKFGSVDEFLEYKDKNPLDAIGKLGLDFEKLTEYALSSDEDPVKKLEKKLSDWEQRMEEDKKRREIEDNERKINGYKAQIKAQIEADADQFDMINATENFDLVYDVIAKHFEKTHQEKGQGEVLSIAEAAKKVENYLEKEFESRIMRSKKFSSKFKTQKEDPQNPLESTFQAQKTDTLTNDFAAQVQSGASQQSLLDREASLLKAAQLLRFKD